MKFGEKLQREALQEWKYAYISYDSLKSQLDVILRVADEQLTKSKTTAEDERRLNVFKTMFQRHLDSEIVKVLDFYSVMLNGVQDLVEQLQEEQEDLLYKMKGNELSTAAKIGSIEVRQEKWRSAANTTKNLLEYISINTQALRKIVKKKVKKVKPLLPTRDVDTDNVFEIQHPTEPETKLVQATFLKDEEIRRLEEMQEHKELKDVHQAIRLGLGQLQNWLNWLTEHPPTASPMDVVTRTNNELYESLIEPGSVGSTFGGSRGERETPQWAHAVSNVSEFEPVLRDLRMASDKAMRNAKLISVTREWYESQAGIFGEPPTPEDAVATSLGLLLNMVDTFLYMANYNLVIPLNNQFCDHLGVSTAVGGIIVGAADITALIAAVNFSIWTNHSFKKPLIFSGAILLLGNLFYSLAYDVGGLGLLVAARLITGLGNARSLNRRYIADYVSKRERTKASAGFVGASCLGMAVGPFLALPLSYIPESKFLGLTINNVTIAGWLMATIWVVFLSIAVPFFAEPKKASPKSLTIPTLPQSIARQDKANNSPMVSARVPLLPVEEAGEAGTRENSIEVVESQQKRKYNLWQDPHWMPTIATMASLFLLKVLQQGSVSGFPIFATEYGWSMQMIGLFLAAMGIFVLPVNFLVGILSSYILDRELCSISLGLCLLGSVVVLTDHTGHPIAQWRYFSGFTIIYVATIMLEGAAMSLMSKVIDPNFAKGTINAGLLATEAGSLGRLLGNVFVTLIGGVIGVNSVKGVVIFGNFNFGLFAGLAVVVSAFTAIIYGKLAV